MGHGARMVRFARAATPPLALIVMIAAAALALGRVYAGSVLVPLVAGAGAAAVLISVAARRSPSWLVAPLSVVGLAGYTLGAVWWSANRAGLPGPLRDLIIEAARNGIPRLLTALIPVEPTPDTVIVPVVAAWLAGLAGAELGLRWGRLLIGYGPPVLLFAGALYVVGPNATPALGPVLMVVVAAALGLAVTGRPPAPAAALPRAARVALQVRAVLAALAAIALVAATAPLITQRVEATPVDPRKYVQPPQVDSLDENPLIRISGWALNPDQKLFDVRSDRDEPVRIRLAVLSDYDGITWRVGAVYRGAGRVLPAPATLPANTVAPVTQRIEIGDLSGRLLPAVPTPSRVDGVRVAYDPSTGTMIEPDGLHPGVAYTVSSLAEQPDLNLLTAADVPFGDGIARMLRLGPGAPDQMRELADRLAADAGGSAYQRALGIEDYLATHYRMVADAPSGHAYPNLSFFLFGPANGGGQRGTSEQFAATYAVLARMMGLPTRVVVGFRSATGTGPVRGADAQAWPEIYFNEVGWVAFDPLPKPDTTPETPESEPPKPEPPTPPPSEAPLPTVEPTVSPTAAPLVAAGAGGSGVAPAYAIGGGGLLLLVVAAVCALILMRRRLSRRRLATGTPGDRVAGAWLEVRDALRLAGTPAPAHLSATELAAHAAGAVVDRPAVKEPPVLRPAVEAVASAEAAPPPPELATLVDLVNRDAFAPDQVGETEAAKAATAARAYHARLRAAQSRWRRLLWPLHPGPLRWNRDEGGGRG
ncbi:MAG TPA: transglutaminaseTgpA domain-containing protein [Asanoa sp.]|nr:transglutaminaseTgpA domain-containing protein [Asanoa sp.]